MDVPAAMRRPRIRFPSILLLFFGGLFAGLLTELACFVAGVPKFATVLSVVSVNDGYWIAAYTFLAYDRGWPDLRARFAPIPAKVVALSALLGIGLTTGFSLLWQLLEHWGVKLHVPPMDAVLTSGPHTRPFVFVLIVVLGPAAEELLFRGLLLDWLRQKMATWGAIANSASFSGSCTALVFTAEPPVGCNSATAWSWA
jgi:membrane protease YdiL (CAAX protease family)